MKNFTAGFATGLLKDAGEKPTGDPGSALATMGAANTAMRLGGLALGLAGAGERGMDKKEYRQFMRVVREGGRDVQVRRGQVAFNLQSQMRPKGVSPLPDFITKKLEKHMPGGLPEALETPKKHLLDLADKPSRSIAFHELGHARGEFGGKVRAAVGKASIRARQGLQVARPATGGYALYKAITDPESAEGKAAPYLMAATAPNIVRLPGEAMASTWALAKIKKTMGTKAMLKSAPRLGLAYGTYLASVAGPAVAVELARRVAKPGSVWAKPEGK